MDDTPPVIRVEHLVKQFGDVVAVNDVSFDVRRGEIFAFLGPNGAGKTTTIRMLTTLLPPTAGTLELDGLDPVHQQNAVRQRIGVVFQDPSLDQDLTAWENLDIHGVLYGVPRRERHERATRLLELFELADRAGKCRPTSGDLALAVLRVCARRPEREQRGERESNGSAGDGHGCHGKGRVRSGGGEASGRSHGAAGLTWMILPACDAGEWRSGRRPV